MTNSSLPLAIVLPPLLGAFLAVVFGLQRPHWARRITLVAVSISTVAAWGALWQCAHGATLEYAFGSWPAPWGIIHRIDSLGAVMAALTATVSLAVFVYAGPSVAAELAGQEAAFMATASLLVSALLGMVVTGDLFNLYVFLEIASITAYTLIAAGGGTAALASFRYLLIGTVGASFYLLGLAYIYSLTGTLNMLDMAARLPAAGAPSAIVVAVAFIVTGFGLKMALFPMHGWLPDAYTYAPSAASALLASLMTKVSAFALLRLLYGVLWPTIAPMALPLTPLLGYAAVGAILLGSAMALAQTDLKRLLAYSSIGHLGYVALGVALGNRNGLIGAMLHILAHATMKGCLFLVAGGVSYRFGARNVAVLRGLGARMPVTSTAFVIAALSMIGVPPTAGFFSKWYLLLGSLDAGQFLFAAVLLLSSLLNAWYFFRLIEDMYFGHAGDHHEQAARTARRELPHAMLGPVVVLASAILLIGVFSQPLVHNVLGRGVDALRQPPRAVASRPTDPDTGIGDDATGVALARAAEGPHGAD